MAQVARAAVPEPIARWTFDDDARDAVGTLHGELLGDAGIANGRLVVRGNGHFRTAPLPRTLGARTLVARVKVDPLDQGGGGVLTVQSPGGGIFDAIVYGERRPGQWMAGSDEFRRTQDLTGAFPEEASAGFVHMAITYAADGTIAVYRNGLPYGQPYRPAMGLQEFGAFESEVLMGMRHGPRDRTGGNYFLRAEIDEAALYNRTLTASEVAELAGVAPMPRINLVTNGSFETRTLAPWVVAGQPAVGTNQPAVIPLVVTNQAAQGDGSFRPHPNPGPESSRLSQTVPTEPGTEYVLEFAYSLLWETLGSFAVLINGVEQEAVVIDPSLPLAHQSINQATWAYTTRTFTATGTSTEVAFHFPPDLGGNVLLDDVQVFPATDAGPPMAIAWISGDLTVEEGDLGVLRVRRTGRLDQRGFATVELRPGTATVNGNAADADVVLVRGTAYSRLGLTFQPGQSEVAVTVHGRVDSLPEPPETATLHLLATGNAVADAKPVTVTVISPISRIAVSGWANEVRRAGRIQLNVERGGGGRVRVQTTDAGTAKPGEDFEPLDREVNVTSFQTTSVPLVILGDRRIEGTETIGVRVTPLAADLEVTPPELLIPLEEEPLRIDIGVDSGEVVESDPMVRFTLIRTGQLDSTNVFRVRYRAEGWEYPGSRVMAARSGVDYLPAEGEVEFGPGMNRHSVEVALLNDSEPDGRRGLLLRTLGSPQLPHPLAVDLTALVEIVDDERAVLVQEADLGPFLLDDTTSLSRGPEGQTRLVQAGRIFELMPSGLPDLNFGAGTGQVTDPTGELNDGQRMYEPRRLADGRYVFLAWDRVVRWTSRGQPDPTWGNGTGSVLLPEPFDRLVHLADDGTVTLVTAFEGSARHLRRLLPDGRPDPGFAVREFSPHERFAVDRALSGHLWVLAPHPGPTDPLQLQRLLPDGRPDPDFAPRSGVTHAFGLDARDRAYFAVDETWTRSADDVAPVALVRFLPDGDRDEDYRPARTDTPWVQGEVSPEGSLLGATAGLEFFELNPAGEAVWHWVYPQAGAIEPSATREPDGRIRVSARVEAWFGFPFSWATWITRPYRVSKDGSAELLNPPDAPWFVLDFLDAAGVRWMQSWASSSVYERSLPVSEESRVGLDRLTLMTTRAEPPQLTIQRAGRTDSPATVRGRALPWRKGNWDASAAVPFEVPLPTGTADVRLDLVLPEPSAGTPLTEWLVRIESASGTGLSPLTECRLWVFSGTPPAGELRMISGAGPDTPHTVWLLALGGRIQRSPDLKSWGDIWWGELYVAPVPGGMVRGHDTGLDPNMGFFRLVQ